MDDPTARTPNIEWKWLMQAMRYYIKVPKRSFCHKEDHMWNQKTKKMVDKGDFDCIPVEITRTNKPKRCLSQTIWKRAKVRFFPKLAEEKLEGEDKSWPTHWPVKDIIQLTNQERYPEPLFTKRQERLNQLEHVDLLGLLKQKFAGRDAIKDLAHRYARSCMPFRGHCVLCDTKASVDHVLFDCPTTQSWEEELGLSHKAALRRKHCRDKPANEPQPTAEKTAWWLTNLCIWRVFNKIVHKELKPSDAVHAFKGMMRTEEHRTLMIQMSRSDRQQASIPKHERIVPELVELISKEFSYREVQHGFIVSKERRNARSQTNFEHE